MKNKLNSLHFLQHALIEWSLDNSKKAVKKRKQLERQLFFKRLFIF